MRKQFCLMSAIVVLTIMCFASPVLADLPFTGVNAGAPVWGGSVLFTDALGADIASSGCRTVRVNFRIDGNSTWNETHLQRYDQIIANARNNGLQVLGILSHEIMPVGQTEWNDDSDGDGMNSYVTGFADNSWILINRYKDDIKLFEVWNEPDCWSNNPASTDPRYAGCSYILPRVYANVLAETYKAVIAGGGASFFDVNGISLVTGGLFSHDIGGSYSTSRPYMQEVYDRTATWTAFYNETGRTYPWDYFGYHFYINQGTTVSTWKLGYYLNQITNLKDNEGDASPIIITEIGWVSSGDNTEELQADNLRDAYTYLKTYPGVEAVYWYQWNNGDPNGDWGLVYSIGNYKPAYYEFAAQTGTVVPPIANFSAFPQNGVAPLEVSFSESATGIVDEYLWSFGDGEMSTLVNPVHTYEDAGTYTVSLTVTGPGGSHTETKTGYIDVEAAPTPADLDDDGDVDLADFAVFAHCFTGSGSLAAPAACLTGEIQPTSVVLGWDSASSVSGLLESIATDDLLAGRLCSVEAGGFFGGLNPSADAADLTDGVEGANTEAVISDYQRPALQARYSFSTPRAIDAIHVFAANGDGRVFQNYDVWYSQAGSSSYSLLVENVTSGTFGQVNNNNIGGTLTTIDGVTDAPIAVNVDALRFVFYCTSTVSPANVFWDEWDPGEAGDTDGNARAYVAPVIKEVDVFEFDGPLVNNIADFDGDGDVDAADFATFEDAMTGPIAG